jgi:RNase adaptor protein for sRNA GlmZ degradation
MGRGDIIPQPGYALVAALERWLTRFRHTWQGRKWRNIKAGCIEGHHRAVGFPARDCAYATAEYLGNLQRGSQHRKLPSNKGTTGNEYYPRLFQTVSAS